MTIRWSDRRRRIQGWLNRSHAHAHHKPLLLHLDGGLLKLLQPEPAHKFYPLPEHKVRDQPGLDSLREEMMRIPSSDG